MYYSVLVQEYQYGIPILRTVHINTLCRHQKGCTTLLDRTKYVGINAQGVNKAQISRQIMEREDTGEMAWMYMEHIFKTIMTSKG